MPRRREIPEREIIPDSRYNSQLVSKFINVIMRDGKKSTAESILYKAFNIIEKKTNESPLKVFEKALENALSILKNGPEEESNSYRDRRPHRKKIKAICLSGNASKY